MNMAVGVDEVARWDDGGNGRVCGGRWVQMEIAKVFGVDEVVGCTCVSFELDDGLWGIWGRGGHCRRTEIVKVS